MVARLPYFAGAWVAGTVVWSTVLAVDGRTGTLAAIGWPLVHAATGCAMVVVCRRAAEPRRVLGVVVAGCVLLGVLAITRFAAVGGDGDFLAYVLLTLYLLAALFFMWGWRAEVVLWAVTAGVWALSTPTFHFHVPPLELAAAIGTGSVICFALAENGARSFAKAHRHRVAEEESRRALEASHAAYRDLAEQAHEPIFAADLNGRLTYVNAALARRWEEPAERLVGRHVTSFLTDSVANDALRALLAAPPIGESVLPTVEFEARTVDGPRAFEAVPTTVHASDGLPAGLRAICRDVTERKRLERERDATLVREHTARVEAERARLEAEAAARAREDFLALLSHELRSPIHTVLTWAHMLRAGLVEPQKVAHAIERIETSSQAQARLVADLLDISRIAAGKFSIKREYLDLGALLASAMEEARAAADDKGLAVEAPAIPRRLAVRGDPMRLGQVFANLLSNAVKFTPAGGSVRVTVRDTDREARIRVEDTGIGIAPDVLPRIFDPFQQADLSITRQYGGLGLGLALARRLVELHGGRLTAASAGAGRGAAFEVILPIVQSAGEAALAATTPLPPRGVRPDLERLRVLVVDDEANAREVVTTLLARCGADVRAAASVAEALAQLDDNNAYDVLVADLALPDEDGFSLIRKLRARKHGRALPAIALTALVSQEDRTRAMDEGFDEHLGKPIDPERLIDAIIRSVGRA